MRDPEGAAEALLASYVQKFSTPMPPVQVEHLAFSMLRLTVDEDDEPAHNHPDAEIRQCGRFYGLLLPEEGEIILNRRYVLRSAGGRRFTIAHEIGHFILHYGEGREAYARSLRGDGSLMEAEADRFATTLLLPRTALLADSTTYRGKLTTLAARWDVPRTVMAERLRQLQSHLTPW